jgi:hypothetical protein
MERILGVPEFNPYSVQDLKERVNTDAADSLEELEKRDAARNRYQRLYWETVAEHGGVRISLVVFFRDLTSFSGTYPSCKIGAQQKACRSFGRDLKAEEGQSLLAKYS